MHSKQSPPALVTHVLFDFDGTLSGLRSGWPDLMVNLFCGHLDGAMGDPELVKPKLRRMILALNGKPSIHQMEKFVTEAQERGICIPTAQDLSCQYASRLDDLIQSRLAALKTGEKCPKDFIITGAIETLDWFQQRGLKMFIVSGTDETHVRREAEILGLARYFGDNIFGSTPGQFFSKQTVIDGIIRDGGIAGNNMLSFGDGPVEIFFTKQVGGRAVGIASDEVLNDSGTCDPDKKKHLEEAGADMIFPDYRGVWPILRSLIS